MDATEAQSRRPGLARSLRLRLSASLTVIVLLISGVGVAVDYRREREVHVNDVLESLAEQARGLALARRRLPDNRQFARFVDDFCAQMNRHISPGHHILVLDANGQVLARSHRHSGLAVENALLAADPNRPAFAVGGHLLAQVRLPEADGSMLVLAQYLDHMERILRRQLISRAVAAGIAALAVIALIYTALHAWVIRPLRQLAGAAAAWSSRGFTIRAPECGPGETRLLAREFNAMAGELLAHERRRKAEMELARKIQQNLLPDGAPSVPGARIAAEYHPVAHVAGDLYDIFPAPDGSTAFVVLDVVGHGVSAALLTGVVKMSLRYRLAETADAGEALKGANVDILACTASEHFATASVGLLDPQRRRWTYAVAGHPAAVLLRDRRAACLPERGPLLGVIAEAAWASDAVDLAPGDRLVLCTDGVLEAGAPADAMKIAGLLALVERSAELGLPRQLATIRDEAFRRARGSIEDDMTLLGIEIL